MNMSRELIEERQDLFFRAFSRHPAVMMLVDPGTGAIIEMNRTARDFYGYSRDALRQMRLDRIDILPLPEKWRENRFTSRHRLASGEIRDVEIFSAPVRTGQSVLLFFIIFDLTDHGNARGKCRQSEQPLENVVDNTDGFVFAKDLKGRLLLENMSHEIRTPLNAILGYSRMMRQDDALSPENRQNLCIINRNGEYLLKMLNDVLELSKIEAGHVRRVDAPFNLETFVDDIVRTFQPQCEAKSIDLAVTPGDSLPETIITDQGKLRQIICNIMANAVKFTEEGGVTLAVGSKAQGPGAHLVFEIEDTGVGIPDHEAGRIFDIFYTGVDGTKTKTGAGLGLAISQRYAGLLGGRITVRTGQQGGCFIVEIPAGIAAESREKNGSTSPGQVKCLAPGQKKYRVLVVDDLKDNRDILVQLMAETGFDARSARDGNEALSLFSAWTPDIVFMDIRMPGMGGTEAARRIRSMPGGPDAAVFAVTAGTCEEDTGRCAAAGMDGHISKPLNETQLFGTLQRVLGLKYIYREKDPGNPGITRVPPRPAVTAGMVKKLPASLVRDMNEAVLDGDIDRLNRLINDCRRMDDPLACVLAHLAGNYEYERLLKLFSTALPPD